MYDITPTICSTSYTLYKASHQYFMRSHHIIYDITCTVFITWLPRYLTLHTQYMCPHNTLHMISEQLYAWHTTRFIYDILCTIHNVTSTLWVHTSLYNHIISTAFMTSHTLYTTSHTWQCKSYICHLTLYIWHYIHCICVIKPSVSIVLHPLSVWHYTLYV